MPHANRSLPIPSTALQATSDSKAAIDRLPQSLSIKRPSVYVQIRKQSLEIARPSTEGFLARRAFTIRPIGSSLARSFGIAGPNQICLTSGWDLSETPPASCKPRGNRVTPLRNVMIALSCFWGSSLSSSGDLSLGYENAESASSDLVAYAIWQLFIRGDFRELGAGEPFTRPGKVLPITSEEESDVEDWMRDKAGDGSEVAYMRTDRLGKPANLSAMMPTSQFEDEFSVDNDGFRVIEGLRTYGEYGLLDGFSKCFLPAEGFSGDPDFSIYGFPRPDEIGSFDFNCTEDSIGIPDTFDWGDQLGFYTPIANLPSELDAGPIALLEYELEGGGVQRIIFHVNVPEPSAGFLSLFPACALLWSRRRPRRSMN